MGKKISARIERYVCHSRHEKTSPIGVVFMQYPKVKSVKVLSKFELEFQNDIKKIYNINKLLAKPPFVPLNDFRFLNQVKVEEQGYGIFWNEDIDIAESELYEHGIEIKLPELKA